MNTTDQDLNQELERLVRAEYAKAYHDRGWRPFPWSNVARKPVVQWSSLKQNPPTTEQVEAWFARDDADAVVVITGKETGIIGIDIDRHGDEDGFTSLEAVGVTLPDVPMLKTPRRGVHLLLPHPGGSVATGHLLPGVEVKGEGSSIKIDGEGYVWTTTDGSPFLFPEDVVAPLPSEDLTFLLMSNKRLTRAERETFFGDDRTGYERFVDAYMAAGFTLNGWGEQKDGRCPAHEDANASLSVTEGVDGRVLVQCHAGCAYEEIMEALELSPRDGFTPDEDESSAVVEVDEEVEDDLLDPLNEEPRSPLAPAIPVGGYIREYVDYATSNAMVPKEFALSTALAQMAALLQTSNGVELGLSTWGTGLFLVLVAPPGATKSASLSGMNVLREVLFDGELPGEATPEAMIDIFAEKRDRWVTYSEFSSFMDRAERSYMAGTTQFFNDAFDGNIENRQRRTRGSEPVTLHRPTLTLLGATTYSRFVGWAVTNLVQDGFLTRFAFVIQDELTEYQGLNAGGGSPLKAATQRRLVEELTRLQKLANSRPVIGRELVHPAEFTEDAAAILSQYDQRWRVEGELLSAALEGFANRIGTIAMRMAIGYALSRGSLMVEAEDANHAIAFCEYIRTRSWRLIDRYFGTDTWQGRNITRLQLHMEALAKQTKDGWISRRALSRKASMYGRTLDDALRFFLEDTRMWEERTITRVDRTGPSVHQLRVTDRIANRALLEKAKERRAM